MSTIICTFRHILGREKAGVKKKAWREVSMKTEILAGSGLQQ